MEARAKSKCLGESGKRVIKPGLLGPEVEGIPESTSQQQQVRTEVVNQKKASTHFAVALHACPIALEDMPRHEEGARMGALGLLAVGPCAATALAHAEARRILALVRDD